MYCHSSFFRFGGNQIIVQNVQKKLDFFFGFEMSNFKEITKGGKKEKKKKRKKNGYKTWWKPRNFLLLSQIIESSIL
jgi:hypothetical protein